MASNQEYLLQEYKGIFEIWKRIDTKTWTRIDSAFSLEEVKMKCAIIGIEDENCKVLTEKEILEIIQGKINDK